MYEKLHDHEVYLNVPCLETQKWHGHIQKYCRLDPVYYTIDHESEKRQKEEKEKKQHKSKKKETKKKKRKNGFLTIVVYVTALACPFTNGRVPPSNETLSD